eukprot:g6973.t1
MWCSNCTKTSHLNLFKILLRTTNLDLDRPGRQLPETSPRLPFPIARASLTPLEDENLPPSRLEFVSSVQLKALAKA